jgi:hypothetical protein
MLTKNSTNAQLEQALSAQLETNKCVLFAKAPTSNPEYTTLFFCQKAEVATAATEAQRLLLGWGNSTRILRAIHNSKTSISDNFQVGQTVPLDIFIEEKTMPAYDGQAAKVNPSTGEVITYNGLPIYEHGSLVSVGEGGIKRLERTPAPVANVTASVFAS